MVTFEKQIVHMISIYSWNLYHLQAKKMWIHSKAIIYLVAEKGFEEEIASFFTDCTVFAMKKKIQ